MKGLSGDSILFQMVAISSVMGLLTNALFKRKKSYNVYVAKNDG